MSGEIIKIDDLEAITAELGVNMPAEKMVMQADIVRENAYAAAGRASELLLGLSNELLSALNGKMFEEKITTYHGRDAFVLAKGKKVIIDAKTYNNDNGDGFLVKVNPSKGRIVINLERKQSTAKKMPFIITLSASVAAGTLILGPLGAFFGGILGLIPAVELNCRGLPLVDYNPEKMFRDYEHFAYSLGIYSDEARKFFDEYIALPGAVYGAMENVMNKNKLLAQDLDVKHNDLRLLEEKLR